MVEIEIEDPAWEDALPNVETLVEAATYAALPPGEMGDVVILLTDDASVKDLNIRFRSKYTPTNVLSFPTPAGQDSLGDIALAYGVCTREAAEQAKPLAHHLQHLVAHGVLHLLGYDHQEDDEAEVMEALETQILGRLGIPDPYA